MDEPRSRPILTACRRSLRPIARWLLRSGVTWKEFAQISRNVFVAVATDEFGIKGRPTNVSRVALMTGLTRREVRRQRELLASPAAPDPDHMSHATRVLSAWHQDPSFLDRDGKPLELEEKGEAPSFEALLKRYAGDIPPRALAKELLRAGAVAQDAGGRYRVLFRTYIPRQMDALAVIRSGDVLADVGTTVEYNLSRPAESPSRFERRAHNPKIDPVHIVAFRAFLEREAQALLERADAWLTDHESPDGKAVPTVRLGLGIYQITDSREVEP